ncbi:NDP-sugar pyrophosphorylase family protein [Allocatelliglobosispora scoriae]|uniref:NDP-sugar pyrophosphorylase family protein n=1 Tax=Allocatelliglobosispora scoriae TaxID=643052 RepID=A0A841BMH3_9ACTN|nr:sugar phosphate nucleotidyltransferase [Allocatelliglobosispora scoriae]MBB5869464.1 NDP-sugar pyrophosphorylase family protein [Allocatelliglobosispora scoriae]
MSGFPESGLGSSVCAIVLAAGEGTRLRPLTTLRPKALCPVGNIALLDRAMALLSDAGLGGPGEVAVNAHWLADQVAEHVDGQAHLSVERELLGSAGSVGALREWVDGRAVLVLNADAYLSGDVSVASLLAGWDGRTVRMLGQRHVGGAGEFGDHDFAGISLLPGEIAAGLAAEHSDLVRSAWRPAERVGKLEVVTLRGLYLDCGTPTSYLHANLLDVEDRLIAAEAKVTGTVTRSVIGAGAIVEGDVTECVIWPGAHVGRNERLSGVIRAGEFTVPAG